MILNIVIITGFNEGIYSYKAVQLDQHHKFTELDKIELLRYGS